MSMVIQWAELELLRVENDSEADEEYVLIQVVKAGHTGRYAVVDSTYDPSGRLSNHFRHIFMLPRMIVGKGDYIQIYTGIGDDTSFDNKAGTKTKVLYWTPSGMIRKGTRQNLSSSLLLTMYKFPQRKAPHRVG
jgi:hypothetical protein